MDQVQDGLCTVCARGRLQGGNWFLSIACLFLWMAATISGLLPGVRGVGSSTRAASGQEQDCPQDRNGQVTDSERMDLTHGMDPFVVR